MNAEYVLEQISDQGLSTCLADLIKACEEEIYENAAKAKGGNTLLKRTKAAMRYIKNTDSCRQKGAWMDNGCQCLCNGRTGFVLSKPLEGLPEIKKPMDLFKAIPDTNKYITVDVDIADVKAALKIHNAKYPDWRKRPECTYDIHNSRYLCQDIIDCYDILGGDIVFELLENGKWSPAVLSNENGKAVLVPRRKDVERHD